jgi:hypothetical protein
MKTPFFLLAILVCAALAGQTTWHKIASGTTKKLNTIDFPSSQVGYIGANDSLLLKSTNGGLTWSPVAVSGVTFNLGGSHILNLDFVSDSIGFMSVGPYGGAYKTTDGGSTWTQLVPQGTICFLQGLYFFDAQNGFIAGSGCFQGEAIDKMSSGTLAKANIFHPTWNSAHMVVDIDFYNTSFGLAASRSGNILRTTDGGLNWDSIPTGKPDTIPLTSVAVINNTLAYAGYDDRGNGYGFLLSTDGGLTWSEDQNAATFFHPAVYCLHEAGNGFIYAGTQPAIGNGGLIFASTAGNWTTSAVDHPIRDMTSHSGNVVFGVGDSGYVIVNTLLTGLTDHHRPEHRTTFDVYPNPANHTVHITAPGELNGQAAALKIYAINGQVVEQSIYSRSQPMEISALPPGLYIIELSGDDFRWHSKFIKE